MGRGRAPCCEKVGLNRGAWTPEEDMRLIAYIRKYGHGNWRALPKQAGLLRCGKSCRLRWINYLRPDIKRGNFSTEEEETIIKLHGLLGNKWSKIASALPGRTDNEIKNVWNTHLKKRLIKSNEQSSSSPTPIIVGTTNTEDTPSSSSSGTTSISIEYKCSHHPCQDDTLIDIEVLSALDKIEIPIHPNLDVWDIINADHIEPKITTLTDDINDSIDEILGIDIEPPEAWNYDVVTVTAATKEGEVEEKRQWLAYLEEELGLFDDSGGDDDDKKMVEMVVVGEGDPVRSYFQKKSHSSSSPM